MKLNCSLLNLTMAIGLVGVNYASAAQSSVDGDYYVSPYGSDYNQGTFDQPFATAQKAQSVANAGDVIYFRGGNYSFTDNNDADGIGVLFNISGTKEAPISYFAYPGETPVFDFTNFRPQARIRGFSVRADWLHFKGLEIKGVQQIITNVNESWGIRVENGASYNIFENLNLHHNEGPGLFIADGRDNLVLNVDSHHNYDPDRGGENADGFGCHSNDGGNVFRGSRAWSNSDDGFDFINAPGRCSVEYSIAFYNGFIPDTNTAAGNGTGIKAGGFGLDSSRFPTTIPRHLVRFNISFGNRINGFYSNHHPGGLDFINNTAFNNPYNYNMLADVGSANHFLRNNVSFGTGIDLAKATSYEIDSSHNSWDLDVKADENDFISVNEALATADREADGSLPMNNFLRLLTGSDLIDAGENVGYSYTGNAPDLGAFEVGSDDGQQPAPATSVTLNSQINNDSVELSWSVTNGDISSQAIYRNTEANPNGRMRIASLGANVRSYVDNSGVAGSTYYYWVKEIMSDGSSINSNASSVTLPSPSDTSLTIEEDASGFCYVDGALENAHSGFSNSGYANTSNLLGSGVGYAVYAPSRGDYKVTLRYANGGKGDRPATVIVDGNNNGELALPITGGWSNYADSNAFNVNLSAGNHLLNFISTTSDGLPNIDNLKVSGDSPQMGDCSDVQRTSGQ